MQDETDRLVVEHLQCVGLGHLAAAYLSETGKANKVRQYSKLEKELECLALLRRSQLRRDEAVRPADLDWSPLDRKPAAAKEDGEQAFDWDEQAIERGLAELQALTVEATSHRVVMRKTPVSRSTFYDSLYPEDYCQVQQQLRQQRELSQAIKSSSSETALSGMEQRFSTSPRCVDVLQRINDAQALYQQTLHQLDSVLHELVESTNNNNEEVEEEEEAETIVIGDDSDEADSQRSRLLSRADAVETEACLLKLLPTHMAFKPFAVSLLPDKSDAGSTAATTTAATATTDKQYEQYSLRIISERCRTGLESCPVFPITENSVVVNRYRIVRHLGTAAFSRAVAALDLHTNRHVCLKIVENNKEFLDQSLDEIKILYYLNKAGDPDAHNVLRIFDFFYHKEHLFLVTELLGENLYEFYRFNSVSGDPHYFSLPRVRLVARQVLVGLQYAHSLGIIHADLKPENILLCSYADTRVKIIDFGSSAFVGDALSSYVQSRSYRAPEVILGLRYDQRIDIWSLGCILYEVLTGKVLFVNDTIQALLVRIMAILGPLPRCLLDGPYMTHFFTQGGQVFERVPSDHGPSVYYHYTPRRTSLYHLLAQYKNDDGFAQFVHFLTQLLALDPARRPTAAQALQHPFITCIKD